jgi:spermidine synthase
MKNLRNHRRRYGSPWCRVDGSCRRALFEHMRSRIDYLKLVLGPAAYAQTLVLAIFMGRMAAGAWLAVRWQAGMREPLRAYAIVEGVIALCALGFHSVFELSTHWLQDTVIPQLEQPLFVTPIKWLLCGGLILPQAVLLGMTFPLMSVA